MALFRKNPIKTAEADLARLRQRCDELGGRLRDAETAAEVAVRAQRHALVGGALDDAAVKRVEEECLRAIFRRDAFRDALDETEGQIAEAEARLAGEKDKAERAKAADDLLARATEIDAAATRFPAAIAAVADLHATLIDTVSAKGMRFEVYAGLERSASHVAFNTLHAALTAALPVQVTPRHADAPPARDVAEVIAENMTTPMRLLAEAIRSGAADLTASLPVPQTPAPVPIHIGEREIALSEPVEWIGLEGRLVQAPEGGVVLPGPIAEEVLTLKIGFPIDTPEGAAIVQEARAPDVEPGMRNVRSTRVRRGPPWTRLKTNLFEWTQAERQRLSREAA